MTTFEVLFYMVLGLTFLVVGGEVLVRGATRLASQLGVPPIVVGLTVVAFGTSAPELAVSLNATMEGQSTIALANVVGSNIFNILFILGVAALIQPLTVQSQLLKREVPLMIFVSFLLGCFSVGGHIGYFESALLCFGVVAYTAWLVIEALRNRPENGPIIGPAQDMASADESIIGDRLPYSVAGVIFGLLIVVFGADWLVRGAVEFATRLGVSDTVVGLTIVAAGTSLPEVVTSVMASVRGQRDIAIGNVIGSNLFNILGIVGLSGLFSANGLTVIPSLLKVDIPVMIVAATMCLPLFATGRRLSRAEGGLLLACYVVYTGYLVRVA